MDLPSTSRKNSFSLYRHNREDHDGSNYTFDINRRLEEIYACSDPIYKDNKNVLRSSLSRTAKHKSCSTATSFTEDGCSNHFLEESNMRREDVCLSASDAKLLACQQLMENLTRSIHNTKNHSFNLASRSKDSTNKNILTEPSINVNQHVINEKTRAEKTTYCRPVVNIYSHEFIQKTMERNLKLESLVKKLLDVRGKEKQNEAWNNYINDLKNKHRYYDRPPKKSPLKYTTQDLNPNIINDCFNERYAWKQSHLCEHFLNDIYDGTNETPELSPDVNSNTFCDECEQEPLAEKNFNSINNRYCFPTSPEGKLMMLKREGEWKGHWRCHYPKDRGYDYNTIFVKKERKQRQEQPYGVDNNNNNQQGKFSLKKYLGQKNDAMSRSMQTDMKILKYCKKCFKNSKEDYDNDSDENIYNKNKNELNEKEKDSYKKYDNSNEIENNYTRKQSLDSNEKEKNYSKIYDDTYERDKNKKNYDMTNEKNNYDDLNERSNYDSNGNNDCKKLNCKCNVPPGTLSNIENKLDNLIRSVKTFIVEMQTKKKQSCGTDKCYIKCNLSKCKSDSLSSRLNKNVIVARNEQRSSSSFCSSLSKRYETIDDILYEEMNKSDKVKRDIEEILCNNEGQCAVQITFDIPTKEHSTEVTNSFHQEIVKGINHADSRRMTIAVNTDPLGIQALFRVSTDTVKQILSYMPYLNCYSYLTQLQMRSKEVVSAVGAHYLCNICGAGFAQPSELSDHIQNHNLINPRNCCVCREVVNMKPHRSVLFPCRHCGQVFTRAYCRELHEQTCRRGDDGPDNVSSLTLLS